MYIVCLKGGEAAWGGGIFEREGYSIREDNLAVRIFGREG